MSQRGWPGGAQVEIGSHSMPRFTSATRFSSLRLVFRRQLRSGEDARRQVGVEGEALVRRPRVDAAPVRHHRGGEGLTAFGFGLERLVEIPRRLVLAAERGVLLFRARRDGPGRRRHARRLGNSRGIAASRGEHEQCAQRGEPQVSRHAAEDTRRPNRGQIGSATSSTARNSASTIAVAPQTRTPPRSKHGTSISPYGRPGALPDFPLHGLGLLQLRERHFEERLDLVLGEREDGPPGRHADHRVQQVAADGDGQRREEPEHVDVGRHDANLFVRLAQRGGFDGFALVEPPARQRHLTGVVAQRGAPQRERDVPLPVVRIEQQQRRGMAKAVVRHARLGPITQAGCHAQLGVEPRQRQGQDAPQCTWKPVHALIVRYRAVPLLRDVSSGPASPSDERSAAASAGRAQPG